MITQQKIILFKLDPWIVFFFIFLCDGWDVSTEHLCCKSKLGGYLKEKYHQHWVVSWNSSFFFFSWNNIFAWKSNGQTWLFRRVCPADIFSKMDKVRSSAQEKQLTVFVAKRWVESKNENFEHLAFALGAEWFSNTQGFLIRPVMMVTIGF